MEAQIADLVIVTVNLHETNAISEALSGVTGHPFRSQTIGERVYHDFGSINGTRVYHALSEMGSGGRGGTQRTVEKAIIALNPLAVIVVGIAFGMNEKKQNIGDILISSQLWLYDLIRVGHEIIPRGDKPHASTWLINFFESFNQMSWKGPNAKLGLILTGDKLVDNVDYRDQLLKFESEAIGGEMEGAGVYVSSEENKVDWIVIKAICDWADGQKGLNKEDRQKEAASNAARFVAQSLESISLVSQSGDHSRRPNVRARQHSTRSWVLLGPIFVAACLMISLLLWLLWPRKGDQFLDNSQERVPSKNRSEDTEKSPKIGLPPNLIQHLWRSLRAGSWGERRNWRNSISRGLELKERSSVSSPGAASVRRLWSGNGSITGSRSGREEFQMPSFGLTSKRPANWTNFSMKQWPILAENGRS